MPIPTTGMEGKPSLFIYFKYILPYYWNNSQNIHTCSIMDDRFEETTTWFSDNYDDRKFK